MRQQLAALPIQQRPQRETATPPIPDLMQQDRNTESLFQSLRAAGLLRAETTATPIPPLPTVRPLAINANAANLRISDLELTSVSLQK